MMIEWINIRQFGIGTFLLIIGALIYLFDRHPDTAVMFYGWGFPSFYLLDGAVFGKIGDSLPSFIHVVSFSLLMCAFLPNQRKVKCLLVSGFWFLVDLAFECIQAYNWLELNTEHNNLVLRYAQEGVFDYMDILSIVTGGIVACLVTWMTMKGESYK